MLPLAGKGNSFSSMHVHNCEGSCKFNCQIRNHLSQHIPATSQHPVLSTTHRQPEPNWSVPFRSLLTQHITWVLPQGQLQVTRLKQVRAPLGAEGWDGAKPWVLRALCWGLLLWNKCHFLLAWAWFLFAVSCLANCSQTFCHPAFHAEWGYHRQKGAFFLETLSHSTHPRF